MIKQSVRLKQLTQRNKLSIHIYNMSVFFLQASYSRQKATPSGSHTNPTTPLLAKTASLSI